MLKTDVRIIFIVSELENISESFSLSANSKTPKTVSESFWKKMSLKVMDSKSDWTDKLCGGLIKCNMVTDFIYCFTLRKSKCVP